MTDKAENWPLYRGTKMLKAVPMTKAEYCLLRGWQVPENEDPAEHGYTVEYQDGGKPNLAGFVGYVSWSPADVFRKAYQPIGTHVDRMKLELAELDDRRDKLRQFIGKPGFKTLIPADKQFWMNKQLYAMDEYAMALRSRLGAEESVAEPETAK